MKNEVIKGEFSIVIEGMKEYNDRIHCSEDTRQFSLKSVQSTIQQLHEAGVDKSILQKVFSSTFQVMLVSFNTNRLVNKQ